MSIARVTMLEFFTEEDLVNCERGFNSPVQHAGYVL